MGIGASINLYAYCNLTFNYFDRGELLATNRRPEIRREAHISRGEDIGATKQRKRKWASANRTRKQCNHLSQDIEDSRAQILEEKT